MAVGAGWVSLLFVVFPADVPATPQDLIQTPGRVEASELSAGRLNKRLRWHILKSVIWDVFLTQGPLFASGGKSVSPFH